MNAQTAKLTYTAIPSDERKPYWNVLIGPYPVALDCEKADAKFIAGAFNVYHETGLTPRQLADQRAELLEALRKIHGLKAKTSIDGTVTTIFAIHEIAYKAIARATGEQP